MSSNSDQEYTNDKENINDCGTSNIELKKGTWSSEEDKILEEYVKEHGEGNWNAIHKNTKLARCGKSCRLRWSNHLQPNLKKEPFSNEERYQIIRLHAKFGPKWAKMSLQLPGRTDNEIKNFWNTRKRKHEKKGIPLYPQSIKEEEVLSDNNGESGLSDSNNQQADVSQKNMLDDIPHLELKKDTLREIDPLKRDQMIDNDINQVLDLFPKFKHSQNLADDSSMRYNNNVDVTSIHNKTMPTFIDRGGIRIPFVPLAMVPELPPLPPFLDISNFNYDPLPSDMEFHEYSQNPPLPHKETLYDMSGPQSSGLLKSMVYTPNNLEASYASDINLIGEKVNEPISTENNFETNYSDLIDIDSLIDYSN